MAVDLSEYKEAIANAYEGRAVRDAIVAMVQAVEDAINAGGSGLDTRVTALETTVSGTNGLGTRMTNLESTVGGPSGITTQLGTLNSVDENLMVLIQGLDGRVTALEGGSNS